MAPLLYGDLTGWYPLLDPRADHHGEAAAYLEALLRGIDGPKRTLLECDEGSRSLHGVEWSWDADPGDETYQVEYALLLRDGVDVKRCTPLTHRGAVLLRDDEGGFDEVFLGRR